MNELVSTTLEEIRARAVALLQSLTVEDSNGASQLGAFEEAREALEALPLNTEDSVVARNRLKSAYMYLETGERCAAVYELRLLTRRLGHD